MGLFIDGVRRRPAGRTAWPGASRTGRVVAAQASELTGQPRRRQHPDARVSSNPTPGTGTMSPTAISFLLRLVVSDSKDHEVAASRHADTPAQDETVRTGQALHAPLPWT